MLLWFKSVKDLDFRRLMSVYEEGNLENAADRYPDLPPLQGIMQAEQDFYQFLREIFFPTEGAVYAVWEENGEYISGVISGGRCSAAEANNHTHAPTI